MAKGKDLEPRRWAWLCRLLPHDWNERFNHEYRRFERYREVQGRYVRRCRRCGRIEMHRVDMLGYTYWQDLEAYKMWMEIYGINGE